MEGYPWRIILIVNELAPEENKVHSHSPMQEWLLKFILNNGSAFL